ncbi:OLC1v1032663C1 [Oldenlandia corymbosa var. corymbosa]|uniref:OLC1v1032663C1 n=1 Tax=Oldenlandia corymbosa var. corymbosa TaxID=529605 RepID=A0AAV1CM86_OLDCO|nr:OLC1v1032663C1 [Oldenlandia corymbosa var. corymbosa]
MWQDGDSNLDAPSLRLDESTASPVSILTNPISISLAESDLVEESQPINLGREKTSQCSNSLSQKSGLLKRNNLRLGELMGSEDIVDESLTRDSKRIRQGESESDESPASCPSISQFIPSENSSRNCLALAPRRLEKEFHHGQMECETKHQTNEQTTSSAVYEVFFAFRHHSSTLLIDSDILKDTCWMLAAIRENLLLHIQGWWGRLAFPPSKCLTEPAPKPFYCCIFPSYDPIFVPPNVCLLDEAALLAGTNVAESALVCTNVAECALVDTNIAESVCSQPNSVMKKLVSEAFMKAGEQLQTDLLNILRALDIKDHEIMRLESNAAFEALDSLGINNKKFRQEVKEFIVRASLLSKIDQSIANNHSCQKLADRLNCQKLKLKEIKDTEAKVVDTLSVSKRRAANLTEEISHLKDKLRKAEAELFCCKADSTALESRVSQISKDKVKAEQYLRRTCIKLKNAWQLRKHMEAEKQAANTAFEKAKLLIWG